MDGMISGLAAGVAFGYLAQRARVLRYDKQLGALRLHDLTIVKFMLSAVLVAMAGLELGFSLGLAQPEIKPLSLGGNLAGGLLFGLGWGLAGYCPGTALGALGEGRLDAVWVILGMLGGAALFAEFKPALDASVLAWGALGKPTLAGALGVSPWLAIAALWLAGIGVLVFLERRGL